MTTTCKACNLSGIGMIEIFAHPNYIHLMFNQISGIEVIKNDHLCIPCYDDLKIGYNFRQKCIQSDLYRQQNISTTLDNSNGTDGDITSITSKIEIQKVVEVTEEVEDILEMDEDCCEANEYKPEEPNASEYKTVELTEDQIVVINPNEQDEIENDQQMSSLSDSQSKTKKTRGKYQTKLKKKSDPISTNTENDEFVNMLETQCEFCLTNFETVPELVEHGKIHENEEKPYRCNFKECSAQFKDKFGLRNHVIIHSEFKRFQCQYCKQGFHQRGNLKAHERLHTGERPFICSYCGKGFAENGNLKTHLRFHTGERPYACQECPKRFKTHYSHKIHMRSHTQERPYSCECGKSFFSSGKLLIHKRIHTGYRPYKCESCLAAFVDSSGLRRHTKIH